LIGRLSEIAILNDLCSSSKSELIALYGRRRIGKTYLINYMFNKHKKECIFFRFTGSYELDSTSQRENFIEAIFDWFGVEPKNSIDSWTKAFNFLKRTIQLKTQNNKVVLFIDEIPWIDKKNNNGFLGALGHFWNDFCEPNKNIIMILCGSNSSWIKNKIFEDSEGPLYQRLTEKIHLKPFDLKETKEYLIKEKGLLVDDKSVVELYMIFGGVAKYLSFINPKKRIDQNIDELFFKVDGHLNKEFTTIFKSLYQDRSNFLISIINFLAKKQSGFTLNEIAEGLNIKLGAKLKDGVEDLLECGFILGLSKFNSKINAKYIISDPFIFFYQKWLGDKSKNDIMNLSLPYWNSIATSQRYSIWSGFAFETVCLSNINLYLDVRKTKGLMKSYSYWSYKSNNDNEQGAQIDILIEYANNVYEIVECKFYTDEFEITDTYRKNILNKINMFSKYGVKGKYELKFSMLTSYGCKNNIHYNNLPICDDVCISQLI